ncbi:MAG: O-antigen ligase family protein [Acidobacteriota bacterium]
MTDSALRLPRPLALVLPVFVFSAFLTQVKFIPGVRNNIGPFEVLGGLLIATFFLFYRRPEKPLRWNPIMGLVAAILALAAVSQSWMPPTHTRLGIIQVAILVFLLLFLITLYNLILQYQIHPAAILRLITLSILIVGPWVILSGVQAAGDYQASGPFRNRAHMGSYMLSAFWLVLLYTVQPNLKKLDRLFANGALCLTLYGVAVSGRRSVYLSLIFGLAGLAVGFLFAHRGKRLTLVRSAVVTFGFLAIFYTFGALLVPQASFFKERVGMIGSRLQMVFAPEEDLQQGDSFFTLQRKGVMMAFDESPLFGIGWGGFAKSRFSPTGHEVHSTPLRFLAELGIVGLALYLLLMAYLLYGSARMFWDMRRTAYGGVYLILMVSLWSLSVSYVYNRHITERAFWLLLLMFLILEAFARAQRRAPQRAHRPAVLQGRQRPALGTAMALPRASRTPGVSARGQPPSW